MDSLKLFALAELMHPHSTPGEAAESVSYGLVKQVFRFCSKLN